VEARVHLLGLRSDVAALLSSADVFALPSLSEGLPMALLEAMFASLPVVATRVGQVPEVLDGGQCGLLVPPGNAKALAGALRVFLTDPAGARRMGRRARDRALQDFSVERMAARYTAVYGRLLRTSRRASVPDAARARPGSSASAHSNLAR
jgi:glycosyltransferase involved in cell wall biosynthesis